MVYTNDIKHLQTSLKTGFSEYRVKAVLLTGWNSKQVLGEIEEALTYSNVLNEEQMTALGFVPVMSHSDERVEVILESVKMSHRVSDSQSKIRRL